jgi:hypothetical protein
MLAIMKNIRRVAIKAEEASENLAEITGVVSRRVAAVALSGLGASIFRWFKNKK